MSDEIDDTEIDLAKNYEISLKGPGIHNIRVNSEITQTNYRDSLLITLIDVSC